MPAKKKRGNAAKTAVTASPKEEVGEEENGTNGNEEIEENGTVASPKPETALSKKLKEALSPRSATGVLSSQYLSRDVKIGNFSLSLYGQVLITDTQLEFNYGRRYGLIGLNGTGKSTLLKCIAEREIPIPEHITIFYLDREIDASEKSALESVTEDLEREKARLEKEAEELAGVEGQDDRLMDIYDTIDGMDADTATKRAGTILHGLGFTKEMQNKKTKDFSGGWRMRIALAKALFVEPTLLLLDEPTNHLDLEATVWLEDYLSSYKRMLIMISHSQDFLNNVCTNIVHLQNQKMIYYGGNYDTYIKARSEKEENQMKQFNWEQDQIAHMKEYIARFGHGSAKLARQAQSKEKTLAKMQEQGLTEKVTQDRILTFYFTDCGKLPPPVLTFTKVCFGYQDRELLYKDLEFGIDLDSRVALVGPNGAGKSTLLKLMLGHVTPTSGTVRRHNHLKIGHYHQHLAENLDMSQSPLEYMMSQFPGVELEAMRRVVGRYGITGKTQTLPISTLSDGQRSRVAFSWLAFQQPHLLLLDEPTNHLDIETIDALAQAINNFEGGVVLVSHDFRLINQVAKEIWVCEKKKVTPWKGNIMDFKKMLKEKMLNEK
jgi:ATP-binding cassette subfamily F protein 2